MGKGMVSQLVVHGYRYPYTTGCETMPLAIHHRATELSGLVVHG